MGNMLLKETPWWLHPALGGDVIGGGNYGHSSAHGWMLVLMFTWHELRVTLIDYRKDTKIFPHSTDTPWHCHAKNINQKCLT